MFAAGFPPNWNESEFCVEEFRRCGMILTKEGIKQVPERVEALGKLKDPENFDEAESLIGMIGWQREFVNNLAGLMKPIYDIQNAERKRKEWRKKYRGYRRKMPDKLMGRWVWSKECKEAKRRVLEEMKKDVLLYRTDERGILKIYVDFAEKNNSISAFLSQEREGEEVPISYASRKLRENETDSGTPFCELLAIEFGINKFENIISGLLFILTIDPYKA